MNEQQSSPYVYRLFEGTKSGLDWHDRGKTGYEPGEIAQIKDPASISSKEVTSIPSPWARLHLFENAFREVTAQAQQAHRRASDSLASDTNYHMLVSDALDVAQCFFNFENMVGGGKKMRILAWNRQERINALRTSRNKDHKLLGETLDLFLEQDKEGSNFDLLQSIYLLFVDDVLVGGTSPSTLFFAAYNEAGEGHNAMRKLGQLGLVEDQDIFFDAIPNPLYCRSKVFLRYLYGLFYAYPVLKERMKYLWDYMDVNKRVLQELYPDKYLGIRDILDAREYNRDKFESEFVAMEVANGSPAYIFFTTQQLGYSPSLRKKGSGEMQQNILEESGFIIRPDRGNFKFPKEEQLPMALQNGFNKPLPYCGGIWSSKTKVPYQNDTPLDRRILPGESHLQYPYLTVSDLLEPCLLWMRERPIDENHFFSPHKVDKFNKYDQEKRIPGEGDYLLPLTDLFFKYFDRNFLEKRAPDGKPYFQLLPGNNRQKGAIKAELRIPLRRPGRSDEVGDFVIFERTYLPSESNLPREANIDKEQNDGALREAWINAGFFPFFSVEERMNQHIALIDHTPRDYTGDRDFALEFRRSNETVTIVRPEESTVRTDRQTQTDRDVTSTFYYMKTPYDYIRVGNGSCSGVLIPRMQNLRNGSKKAYVAIDLGTTNTHVALAVGDDKNPEPFSYNFRKGDEMMVTLSAPWVEGRPLLSDTIRKEMLPFELEQGHQCFLPMRTVLSELTNVPLSERMVMGNTIIPFLYERLSSSSNETVTDNLKWRSVGLDDDGLEQKRLEHFIEVLYLLAKAAVVQKGGDLNKISLMWSYPTSMGVQQVQHYGSIWKELGRKHFGPDLQLHSFPEAIVPYYAFGPNKVLSKTYPVINIDIGGGTTDVFVVKDGKPAFHTSFRFAGNVLFGNGYGRPMDSDNGFARMFRHVWEKRGPLTGAFVTHDTWVKEISKKSSENINSFFFSFEKNLELREKKADISFDKVLRESEDARFVFAFFYGAIIYHIARLLSTLKHNHDFEGEEYFGMPRHIVLSGKASNVVNFFGGDKQQAAVLLTKKIFEAVYKEAGHSGTYYEAGLDIHMNAEPKESTCNGGIALARKIDELKKNAPDAISNLTTAVPIVGIMRGELGDKGKICDMSGEFGKPISYREILTNAEKQYMIKDVDTCIKTLIIILQDNVVAKQLGLKVQNYPLYEKELQRDMEDSYKHGLEERMVGMEPNDPVSESPFFYGLVQGMWHLITMIANKNIPK